MTGLPRRVRFEYCISCLVFTWHRTSEITEIPHGKSAFSASLPYSIITVCFGWWGIPWGIILTPRILVTNSCGGVPLPMPATYVAQPANGPAVP